MVTIGMNYKVLPGKEGTFETAFRKVITAMQKPGGAGAPKVSETLTLTLSLDLARGHHVAQRTLVKHVQSQ